MEHNQLKSLVSLRFIAAAMIVLFHSGGRFGLSRAPGAPFVLGQAVTFFFVLSGFIMTHLYPTLSTKEIPRFFLARLARIWPLHILCLLFAVLFLGPSFEKSAGQPVLVFLSNLTLTHAWVPIQSWYFSYNGVSWSDSTCLFFYVSFPFLIRDIGRTWRLKLLLAFLLVLVMIALGNALGKTTTTNNVDYVGLVYISPLCRIFEFILGMCGALAFRKLASAKAGPRWHATLIELLVLVLLLGAMYESTPWADAAAPLFGLAGRRWLHISGFVSIFFAAFIVVYALGRGWISKLLATRPLVHLGEISYAMFLLHQLLLRLIANRAPGLWEREGLVAYLGFWAVLLLLSDLLSRWVERPMRVWILQRFGQRSSRAPQVPAASARRWRVAQVTVLCALLVVAWSPARFSAPADASVSSPSCAALAEQAKRKTPSWIRGAVERIERAEGTIVVSGWATDSLTKKPASDVLVCWNGRPAQQAHTRHARPDLVKAFGSDSVLNSGFKISVKLEGTVPERCDALVYFGRAADGSVAQLKVWDQCRVN